MNIYIFYFVINKLSILINTLYYLFYFIIKFLIFNKVLKQKIGISKQFEMNIKIKTLKQILKKKKKIYMKYYLLTIKITT